MASRTVRCFCHTERKLFVRLIFVLYQVKENLPTIPMNIVKRIQGTCLKLGSILI